MFLNKHDPCGFSQGEADTTKKKRKKKKRRCLRQRKGRALDNNDTFGSDTKRREERLEGSEVEVPFTLKMSGSGERESPVTLSRRGN